jgi:hypothetical protein
MRQNVSIVRRNASTFVITARYLGNVSDASPLGVSALINPIPNTKHVTLKLLTTSATFRQIELNVQLDALVNILEFGIN